MKDANGKWIGFGLGDAGPQVAKIQHRLIYAYPKNSKAVELGVKETGTFDQATVSALENVQPFLKPAQAPTGIANYDSQVALGAYIPAAPNLPATRPTFITVNGTGSPDPFGPGFSGALGASLDPKVWYWQPVAYPAATFPMGPSVQAGRAEVNRQIGFRPPGTPIGMSGYSQGALVTDFVWRDDILSPSGMWHSRYLNGDFNHAIVNFGDPMRAPGICHGNEHAGFAVPANVDGEVTGGIAGALGDLTAAQTPDFLLSCNNNGDLYGAAPFDVSGPGSYEAMIFNIIQNFSFGNIFAIAAAVLPLLLNIPGNITQVIAGIPTLLGGGASQSQVISVVQALMNGGMFVVTGMSAHGDYQKMVPAMTNFVMQAGKALG